MGGSKTDSHTFIEHRGYIKTDTIYKSFLWPLVQIAGLLFTGMWLKKDTMPAKVATVNESATYKPQAEKTTPAASSTIGGADKLKIYKELLDTGIITEEEFQAKKKELLNL